eukprot:1740435-Rhodomonas_salina.2
MRNQLSPPNKPAMKMYGLPPKRFSVPRNVSALPRNISHFGRPAKDLSAAEMEGSNLRRYPKTGKASDMNP